MTLFLHTLGVALLIVIFAMIQNEANGIYR